jgi:hypothetical protein
MSSPECVAGGFLVFGDGVEIVMIPTRGHHELGS